MAEEIEAVAPSEATPEVVQPETEQDENTAGQPTEPPASETEEKSEAQKRRERRKAQEQRQQEEYSAAQQKAQEAEARLARIKASAQGVEPKEADFQDVGEYWAAKGAWNYARQVGQVQVAEVSAEAEQAKATLEYQRAAQISARQVEFQAEAQDARTRYADFDAALAVATNTQFVSPQIAEMVLSSEQPADLAYHLGKNPQLAVQLSQMPPLMAARELGKIEATLTAPAPKISKAPPPINPVRPNGTAVKRLEDMTASEYAAFRARGGVPT
jgi:hypothetical protein